MTLLILFVVPFIASLIAFLIPNLSKGWAFLLSVIPLAMLLIGGNGWLNNSANYPWIPALSVSFHLSIDALSLLFLYLTAIIIPISILSATHATIHFPGVFYGLILFLQGLLIGFFTSRDLVLFTIFWEAVLLPLYLLISFWGGPQRRQAAIKFFVYMIAGSALMVLAVLSLYMASASIESGTFDIDSLQAIAATIPYAGIIWAIFLFAFAVKTPLFPFHAWLPDTYYQASTPGTILLSAILSKAGIYGFLRIALPFFPTYMQQWSPLLLTLALVGVFYAAFAAWMQKDFKRLIAYSSLSHVNFILAGLFVSSQMAHSGAILQAFNHGITIAALFLVVDWLSIRLGSTAMHEGRGVATYFPWLCWLTLFFVLSNVALPGTSNFIGELMILLGMFAVKPWLAAIAGLTIIFSVIYMLRWMQQVYFGTPIPKKEGWIDINAKHLAIAAPLIALTLWVGIYPKPFLEYTREAASKIITFAQEKPL